MAKKILLVGDNTDQRRVVHGILEPMGTILEASNGKDALRLIATEKPEMMLLDAAMVDLDGLSIMRAAHFLDPALPIVLLTEEHDTESAKSVLANGISAYIAKPFYPEGLRDKVRRLFTMKI